MILGGTCEQIAAADETPQNIRPLSAPPVSLRHLISMKTLIAVLLAVTALMPLYAPAQEAQLTTPAHSDFDDTSRFIFFSVLEGLYEDGLSSKDVDQILMKKDGQSYFHFIYACPICTATIWALQTYRARPEHLYSLKSGASTFGRGLSEQQHQQLYSDDHHQRLIVINTLMQGWMKRRTDRMNLSEKDRMALLDNLEKKRKEGMDVLESFRHHGHGPNFGVPEAAPAYVDLEECAVCNGAVGKLMKLPSDPSPTPK